MPDEFQSRRCMVCSISWPLAGEFERCPACGRYTSQSSWTPSYDFDAAMREKREYEFERYYERRGEEDRKLMQQVDPFAFAQYLMDAAHEQIERDREDEADVLE